MINFFKGSVPWAHVRINKNSPRFRKIGELKTQYLDKELLNDLPPIFCQYMIYCKNLRFDEAPNFDRLKEMVRSTAQAEGIDLFDNLFDWNIKQAKQKLYRTLFIPPLDSKSSDNINSMHA